MLTLFVMPSATSTLTEASDWSSAIFDEAFPVTYIVVGIALGSLLIVFLIGLFMGVIERFGNWVIGKAQGRHVVHNFPTKTNYIVPFHEDTVVTRHGEIVDRYRH